MGVACGGIPSQPAACWRAVPAHGNPGSWSCLPKCETAEAPTARGCHGNPVQLGLSDRWEGSIGPPPWQGTCPRYRGRNARKPPARPLLELGVRGGFSSADRLLFQEMREAALGRVPASASVSNPSPAPTAVPPAAGALRPASPGSQGTRPPPGRPGPLRHFESQPGKHRLESGSSALPGILYPSAFPLVNPSAASVIWRELCSATQPGSKVVKSGLWCLPSRGWDRSTVCESAERKGRRASFLPGAIADSSSCLNRGGEGAGAVIGERAGKKLEDKDTRGLHFPVTTLSLCVNSHTISP